MACPIRSGRIYTLDPWQGNKISDPYNESEVKFMFIFQLIDQGVFEWLRKLDRGGNF